MMMKVDLQKMGGIAALIMAATFLFGIAMFATVMTDYTSGDLTPGETVTFFVDHQVALFVWNLVIYLIFGIALVPLALAIYSKLKINSVAMAQTATIFGFIWAGLILGAGMVAMAALNAIVNLNDTDPSQAATVWLALDVVELGLTSEVVSGTWVLLVSWAALQAGVFPKALNYLGLVIGVAGPLTILPALEILGIIYGLGFIVWFIWIGIWLLRGTEQIAPSQEASR